MTFPTRFQQWSSLFGKKDSSLWPCVDFQGLNQISKQDRYPLLLISDLLDAPWKAQVYTKIDLRHVYHLVRISPGDEWKTAFWTNYGSFEWLVMPEGFTNAPTAFQRFMNNIFSDMIDIHSHHIFGWHPHLFWQYFLTQKLMFGKYSADSMLMDFLPVQTKCEFHVTSCEYLRYMLSPEGLTMASNKVQIIPDWPVPQKVKVIQYVLGFTNFYHRFIFGYLEITVLLTCLTCKGTPWHSSDECHSAFEALKKGFHHSSGPYPLDPGHSN